MMPYAQSPIEASIWTAFVGLQQGIVDSVLMTPLFKAAVATWIGFKLIAAIYKMAVSGSPGAFLGQFGVMLVYSAVGLSLLRSKETEDFRPINSMNTPWAETSKVRSSGKYLALGSAAKGLTFYVMIHRGAAEIGVSPPQQNIIRIISA